MSENMIKIRKARLNDVETISTLWPEFVKTQDEIVEKHCPQHLGGFCLKKNSDEIFRDFVRKTIHSKNGLVLLSEVDEKTVGFAMAVIGPAVIWGVYGCAYFPFKGFFSTT